jgi:hypothetical protein
MAKSEMHKSGWYRTGWTDERRAKQREAIHRWKPWLKSTGPRTPEGKAVVAANAYRAYFSRLPTDLLLAGIKRAWT